MTSLRRLLTHYDRAKLAVISDQDYLQKCQIEKPNGEPTRMIGAGPFWAFLHPEWHRSATQSTQQGTFLTKNIFSLYIYVLNRSDDSHIRHATVEGKHKMGGGEGCEKAAEARNRALEPSTRMYRRLGTSTTLANCKFEQSTSWILPNPHAHRHSELMLIKTQNVQTDAATRRKNHPTQNTCIFLFLRGNVFSSTLTCEQKRTHIATSARQSP